MAVSKGRALSEGCYVVCLPGGDVIPESSEIRALRLAVATGGDIKFVKWGQPLSEARAPGVAEAKPRAKKAAPVEAAAPLPENVKAAVLEAVKPDSDF